MEMRCEFEFATCLTSSFIRLERGARIDDLQNYQLSCRKVALATLATTQTTLASMSPDIFSMPHL